MLKIRLSRTGKKRQPSFRVVVQEHTSPIKGKFIENLGSYLPATKEKTFTVDTERAKYWISVGARPSDSVAALLKKNGMEGMEEFIAPRDKQKKKKKAENDEAKAENAEAPADASGSETSKAKEEAAPAPAPEAPKEEAKAENAEAPADASESETSEAEASVAEEKSTAN
ncbi:MAG: 30S ribosomal protein S16 [bacterium]|nr:30S ribosomal protein S16 [bacterium]